MGNRERQEEQWVISACSMCFASCGINVRRTNEVITGITGDPDAPDTNGKLCPKGISAIIGVYDPYRVKTPLMRTNPEKGTDLNPGWREITWEEALEILTQRLSKIRSSDPRKLVVATFDIGGMQLAHLWAAAFGTPNNDWVGYYCGNYLHSSMYLTNGTFHSEFDIAYCNYCILLGNQHGFLGGNAPNFHAQLMAEARSRGLKVVVVDPVCTNAASKADEWIPIRPGTDGALILAMINELVNELGLYDAQFLRKRTNASYLVGEHGFYIRDPETGKPLVWEAGGPRPFDEAREACALEGSFHIEGARARPAFELLKENICRWSPEAASKATTIPAATIRRLAREFGEAAKIGSTIMMDGQILPLRPAAVNIYRGAGAHKHGVQVALAVQTLNMIVGAFYVPGGHRGINLIGPFGRWRPGMSDEGLIKPPPRLGYRAEYYDFEVGPPQTLGLYELFPISTNRSPMYQMSLMRGRELKVPFEVEMLMVARRNLMMNNVNQAACLEALRKVPFLVVFATHLDETAELADLVLPDAHNLERLDLFPNSWPTHVTPGTNQFYWRIRQPVLPPAGQCRRWVDVLWELADHLGFLPELNLMYNAQYDVSGEYALRAGDKYSWEEIYDRQARSWLGAERGLAWLKANGNFKVERTLEERYPGHFIPARYPLYFENILRAGQELKEVTEKLDLSWDTSDYQALPDWKPCPAYEEKTEEDLFAVNFKLPIHFFSHTTQNPWLSELGEHHAYAYKILINTQAAKKWGIASGDIIKVESEAGAVTGEAKVTEGIHPEAVGIAGVFGSWAQGKPLARGKGVHFNSLVPFDFRHIDSISSGVDACVRVKVTKIS